MWRDVEAIYRCLPPISHVIRWSDKRAMVRKTRNFNDANSKFEGVARELRAKLEWGTGVAGVSELRQSYWPRSGVSGARTLRGGGHRHRMITILIHIHVRST